MTHQKTTRLLFLILLLLRSTSQGGVDPEQEVIVESSPCSITCGLGLRHQSLCLLKDSRTALEEGDAEVNTSNRPLQRSTLLMTLILLPVGLREVSCSYCKVSGDMALWTSDHDHDSWTEGGAWLSGGSHESHGKIFLEVGWQERSSFCYSASKSCNLVLFQGFMALCSRNNHLGRLSLRSMEGSTVRPSGFGPCQGGKCR